MFPIETPNKQFVDGNGTTELGTILPAWWLNQIQAELLAVLAAAAQTPNKGEQTQLLDAINKLLADKTPLASANTAGLIKVVDVLTSTGTEVALSAAQGKKLQDEKMARSENRFSRPTVAGGSPAVVLDLSKKASIIAALGDGYIGNGHHQLVLHNTTVSTITGLPLPDKSPVQLDIMLMGGYSLIRCTYLLLNRSFWTPYNFNDDAYAPRWIEDLNSENGLGNSGNQTIAGGYLTINNPTAWTALRKSVADGAWDIEFAPDGSADKRLYIVFRGSSGGAAYLRFENIGTGETVAYKSWVSGNSVMLTGNQTVGGTKTFEQPTDFGSGLRFKNSAAATWAVLGMGTDDVHMSNPISNRYLQLKNDGTLSYNNWAVYHAGNEPAFADINSKPTTVAGYGITDAAARGTLTTQNLDSLTVPGLYGQSSDVNATVARNYPVSKAGSLIVAPSAYGCQQIYMPFDTSDIYKRNQANSGGWTAWAKINTSPAELAAAINALVAAAPGQLDTLKELAAALGNDANFAATMTAELAKKADKATTRAGYGITDASQVAVITGTVADGGTIPLPAGFTAAQCNWFVSLNQSNPGLAEWADNDNDSRLFAAHQVSVDDNRRVTVKLNTGTPTGRTAPFSSGNIISGTANYIAVGIK